VGLWACLITAAYADTATPHLSLDDIDQMARANIARQLNAATPAPSSTPPATVKAEHPVHAVPGRPSVEPVTFVASYADASGATYVLYSYRGAIYPARVGSPLLNGWMAKAVNGFVVTVTDGRRTWKVPVHGEPQSSASDGSPTTPTLFNLATPLPSGGPLPVFPAGR